MEQTIPPGERQLTREDLVEHGAEAVDVAGRRQIQTARGLFWAHERGRPRRDAIRIAAGTGQQGPLAALLEHALSPHGQGQSPIHDQRLAVPSQHDVHRLDVTMEDAAVVRVGDRLTHGHEAKQ